jgi:hypothetical protein
MMSVSGMKGYGWYWIIIEILREQKDYIYIDSKYATHSIAKELQCDVETAKEFIDDCINEFGLLDKDIHGMWSDSLKERMKPLDAKRKRAKDAANKRWGNKDGSITEPSSPPEEIEIEPKEVPIDKVKTLDVLTNLKAFGFLKDDMKKQPVFKGISDAVFEMQRERCIDWLRSKGRRQKDYRAFFRNWMRNVSESQPTKPKDGMVF